MTRPRYAYPLCSKADKPPPIEIDLCPLWSNSGQTRVRLDHPLNATHDCDLVADSKMGSSNWAIMEKSANKCVVSSLFSSCDRRALQRFIGCFVSQNFFFRPVDLARGSVAHRSPQVHKYRREFYTAASRIIQTADKIRCG